MKSNSKTWIWTALLTAVASSLCCIVPLLAFFAGVTGVASGFGWLEPWRPVLLAGTVGMLLLAWYRHFRPKCTTDCCADADPSFFSSGIFLSLVTVLVVGMSAFPYFSKYLYPDMESKVELGDRSAYPTVSLDIEGMTCTGCEEHVDQEVYQLDGVLEASTSYRDAQSIIRYDPHRTDIEQIIKAIERTGYKVVDKSEH